MKLLSARRLRTGKVRKPPLALVAMLALSGFLLVVTGLATSVQTEAQEPRKQALINQILNERSNVDDLDVAVQTVRSQVDDAEARAGALSNQEQSRKQDEQRLAEMAGTLRMKGDGIVVQLSDAPQPSGSGATFGVSRIQDGDLQLIVNALFASGAEAIAINENRVVSVTPIRAAGGTIVVNYRPVNSPYRIVAIGADKKTFRSSDIAKRFDHWREEFGLGFNVSDDSDLTVPGYTGATTISIAHADVPTTTSTSSSTTTSTIINPAKNSTSK